MVREGRQEAEYGVRHGSRGEGMDAEEAAVAACGAGGLPRWVWQGAVVEACQRRLLHGGGQVRLGSRGLSVLGSWCGDQGKQGVGGSDSLCRGKVVS